MKRLIASLTVAILIMPIGLAAGAQVEERNSCPNWIPRADYSDVEVGSTHSFDIDCIRWLSITDRTGTFGPQENLPRWEMATWMFEALRWVQWVLIDNPTTFTDTGGLPPHVVDAIEFVRIVDVTKGVGNDQFAPYGAVPRWQMALFLTRLVEAAGLSLPDGADQGFVDIGDETDEARLAINQLAQLGITRGTSATTYSPDDPVTREQMASFVARTVERIWVLFPVGTCPETNPSVCTGTRPSEGIPSSPLRVRAAAAAWPGPEDTMVDAIAWLNAQAAEIYIDGVKQTLTRPKYIVERSGIAYAFWEATIPAGTSGTVTVETRFFELGVLTRTRAVQVSFS